MVLPSRATTKVKEIVTYDGNLDEAFAPLSVTLTLEDEVDASRGDMIVRKGNLPRSADTFDAMLVWMNNKMQWFQERHTCLSTRRNVAWPIETLSYRIDVNNVERSPAPNLD